MDVKPAEDKPNEDSSIPVTVKPSTVTEPESPATEPMPAEAPAEKETSATDPSTSAEPAATPAEPVVASETPSEPAAPIEATTPEESATPPAATVIGDHGNTSPKKGGFLKWLIIAVVVIAVIAAGYLILNRSKTSTPKTVTTIQSIPLLRYGSLNGPIGAAYVFPNEEATSTSNSIDFQIFEGLIGFQGQKLVPLLATSWTNPNKTTWVFQIAKNVKFQNGTLMTPAIVASSLTDDLANNNWNSFLSTISSAKATGANEVTVTTTQPDALLLNRLVYGFVFTKTGTTTYGTGPYTVDTSKPQTESETSLKAFNGYHGGTPKTQAVSYTIYNDDTALANAYVSKKIDAFEAPPSVTVKKIVGTSATSTEYSLAGAYGLRMNIARKNGVFSNKQVREAFAYAFDRAAYIKQLTTVSAPTQTPLPKTVVGYDASATLPSFDLAKSKQLQAAAGYPDGVPITYAYIKGVQPDAPILIKQLQAAGFKVTDDGVDTAKQLVAILQAGTADVFGQSVFSDYNDGLDVYTQILDSTQGDFPLYNDPTYDAMITAADQAFDPATHIQKVQAITKYITDNYLWVPLRTATGSVDSLPGYQLSQNFTLSNYVAYFWRVGQTVTTTTK